MKGDKSDEHGPCRLCRWWLAGYRSSGGMIALTDTNGESFSRLA